MTDTVNVPTPYMVEQCRKLLQPLAGNDWPKVARQAFALMTAAAPKAEPIGRNITFSPFGHDVGNAVVSPEEPEGPYWTLIAQGGEAEQSRIAAEIVRRLNTQPEAPKVEQEPAAWPHLCNVCNGFVPMWGAPRLCGCRHHAPAGTHPAPASDELLEALNRHDETVSECRIDGARPQKFTQDTCDLCGANPSQACGRKAAASYRLIQDVRAIATHKGPQS